MTNDELNLRFTVYDLRLSRIEPGSPCNPEPKVSEAKFCNSETL